MPSTVTAGRAQTMSATEPSPSRPTPSSTLGVARGTASAGYVHAGPGLGRVEPADGRVAPLVAQRRQHVDERGQRVRGGPAEHARVHRAGQGRDLDDHSWPVRAAMVVTVGTPTAALPVSQTRIASARSRSALARDELLQAAGALLLGALDDELQATGNVVAERAQRGQVHHDVALAVGRPAPVPPAVPLGQLERRRPPGPLVQRRLHVVVGVEQDRRRALAGPAARRTRPGCRRPSAPSAGRSSRSRRRRRAPTRPPARTPRAGTGAGRPPIVSETSSARSSCARPIRSCTRSRRPLASMAHSLMTSAGHRRSSGRDGTRDRLLRRQVHCSHWHTPVRPLDEAPRS